MTLTKDVKFTNLVFEKALEEKKQERPMVSGERDFCATPPFAYHVKEEEIKDLSNNLRKSGRATLYCSAMKSNHCIPSFYFDTSCTRNTINKKTDETNRIYKREQKLVEALFKDMPDCRDP